jgi:hypothetical protein
MSRVKHKATPRCLPSAAAAFLASLPPSITRIQEHAVVADFMAMDPAFANALSASEAFYACSALPQKESSEGKADDNLDKVCLV